MSGHPTLGTEGRNNCRTTGNERLWIGTVHNRKCLGKKPCHLLGLRVEVVPQLVDVTEPLPDLDDVRRPLRVDVVKLHGFDHQWRSGALRPRPGVVAGCDMHNPVDGSSRVQILVNQGTVNGEDSAMSTAYMTAAYKMTSIALCGSTP